MFLLDIPPTYRAYNAKTQLNKGFQYKYTPSWTQNIHSWYATKGTKSTHVFLLILPTEQPLPHWEVRLCTSATILQKNTFQKLFFCPDVDGISLIPTCLLPPVP